MTSIAISNDSTYLHANQKKNKHFRKLIAASFRVLQNDREAHTPDKCPDKAKPCPIGTWDVGKC